MSSLSLDVHALVVVFLLLVWLLVRLVTEYLFRIEHRPRTWVHQICFVVYSRSFQRSYRGSGGRPPRCFTSGGYTGGR